MKRIGYIQGTRIRGPVNLGPLGTLDIAGVSNLRGQVIMHVGFSTAGTSTCGGPLVCSSSLGVGGGSNLNGAVLCNSSLGVAGATTLNGAVICSSTLAIGGTLTIPLHTKALALPVADPTIAGELWVNAGVVTRSAG